MYRNYSFDKMLNIEKTNNLIFSLSEDKGADNRTLPIGGYTPR